MTKRLALLVGIFALALLFHSPLADAQAPPGPIPQAQEQPSSLDAAPQAVAKIITAYTLPPDLYAKTKHIEKIKLAFFIISPIYGLIVLWLFLRWKVGLRYRDWAEGGSKKFFPQVLIFAPLFVLTLDILNIPLSIFEQWELRNYGLSVQGWGSWAWDWTKGELVSVVIGLILILILYFVIRRIPRLWWFYFWLAAWRCLRC